MCSQIRSARELPEILRFWAVGHTTEFSTSREVWRVVGRVLRGEQAELQAREEAHVG